MKMDGAKVGCESYGKNCGCRVKCLIWNMFEGFWQTKEQINGLESLLCLKKDNTSDPDCKLKLYTVKWNLMPWKSTPF